jgi:hypothetical protein
MYECRIRAYNNKTEIWIKNYSIYSFYLNYALFLEKVKRELPEEYTSVTLQIVFDNNPIDMEKDITANVTDLG